MVAERSRSYTPASIPFDFAQWTLTALLVENFVVLISRSCPPFLLLTMAEEDIRNATTISALLTAVNDHYATAYRDLFPDNSPLNAIWDTNIRVEDGSDDQPAFLAEGELVTFPFTFADEVENQTFTIKAKLEIIESSDTG